MKITVYVKPGSKKAFVKKISEFEYEVSVNAPAKEGKANKALIDILADNVDLLVRGQDASFQNKVHLAMVAKGFEANGDAGDAPARPAGPPQEK